ncbi:MAG: cereblon family protein [Polyangia bacterium]
MRHAFKPDGTKKQRRARARGAGADDGSGRHYHCAACTTRVAREAAAIEVGGAHRHRFVNPAGVEFELGCFAEAACRVDGEPTLEFTWFAGCAWSFALCFNCRAHLGWCYEGDGVRFFGLILARLVGPI